MQKVPEEKVTLAMPAVCRYQALQCVPSSVQGPQECLVTLSVCPEQGHKRQSSRPRL